MCANTPKVVGSETAGNRTRDLSSREYNALTITPHASVESNWFLQFTDLVQ